MDAFVKKMHTVHAPTSRRYIPDIEFIRKGETMRIFLTP